MNNMERERICRMHLGTYGEGTVMDKCLTAMSALEKDLKECQNSKEQLKRVERSGGNPDIKKAQISDKEEALAYCEKRVRDEILEMHVALMQMETLFGMDRSDAERQVDMRLAHIRKELGAQGQPEQDDANNTDRGIHVANDSEENKDKAEGAEPDETTSTGSTESGGNSGITPIISRLNRMASRGLQMANKGIQTVRESDAAKSVMDAVKSGADRASLYISDKTPYIAGVGLPPVNGLDCPSVSIVLPNGNTVSICSKGDAMAFISHACGLYDFGEDSQSTCNGDEFTRCCRIKEELARLYKLEDVEEDDFTEEDESEEMEELFDTDDNVGTDSADSDSDTSDIIGVKPESIWMPPKYEDITVTGDQDNGVIGKDEDELISRISDLVSNGIKTVSDGIRAFYVNEMAQTARNLCQKGMHATKDAIDRIKTTNIDESAHRKPPYISAVEILPMNKQDKLSVVIETEDGHIDIRSQSNAAAFILHHSEPEYAGVVEFLKRVYRLNSEDTPISDVSATTSAEPSEGMTLDVGSLASDQLTLVGQGSGKEDDAPDDTVNLEENSCVQDKKVKEDTAAKNAEQDDASDFTNTDTNSRNESEGNEPDTDIQPVIPQIAEMVRKGIRKAAESDTVRKAKEVWENGMEKADLFNRGKVPYILSFNCSAASGLSCPVFRIMMPGDQLVNICSKEDAKDFLSRAWVLCDKQNVQDGAQDEECACGEERLVRYNKIKDELIRIYKLDDTAEDDFTEKNDSKEMEELSGTGNDNDASHGKEHGAVENSEKPTGPEAGSIEQDNNSFVAGGTDDNKENHTGQESESHEPDSTEPKQDSQPEIPPVILQLIHAANAGIQIASEGIQTGMQKAKESKVFQSAKAAVNNQRHKLSLYDRRKMPHIHSVSLLNRTDPPEVTVVMPYGRVTIRTKSEAASFAATAQCGELGSEEAERCEGIKKEVRRLYSQDCGPKPPKPETAKIDSNEEWVKKHKEEFGEDPSFF